MTSGGARHCGDDYAMRCAIIEDALVGAFMFFATVFSTVALGVVIQKNRATASASPSTSS